MQTPRYELTRYSIEGTATGYKLIEDKAGAWMQSAEVAKEMASYILRDIDPALWKRIKTKAASEGISLKTLIEKLVREWVNATQ